MAKPINQAKAAARLLGAKTYVGDACLRGHAGLRYTSTGWCVDCAAAPGEANRKKHRKEWLESGRLDVGETRAQAKTRGLTMYFGVVCSEGHRIRYVSCRSCVDCTRRNALLRDPVQRAAAQKEYWRLHPAKAYAKVRRWILKNPERHSKLARLAWHRRRARKIGADGSHTREELNDLLLRQKGCCAYCGTSQKLSIDHMTPLSRGGSDYISNIQWLCEGDNSRKKDKTDAEARAWLNIPTITPWDAKERARSNV